MTHYSGTIYLAYSGEIIQEENCNDRHEFITAVALLEEMKLRYKENFTQQPSIVAVLQSKANH